MTKKPNTESLADARNAASIERISHSILILQGQKVLLDEDLAALYGVSTKRFNEQVRRNLDRFPRDFMFQLKNQEVGALRSQFATLKLSRGQHRKYVPYAFTEHGAIMAASILNTPRAVEVSVFVVRAFLAMREKLASNQELAKKLQELERKVGTHDQAIVSLFRTLNELMNPPPVRAIGFTANLD